MHTSHLIDTPRGPAAIQLTDPAGPPSSLLVLGHGAGGDTTAPDLTALHDAAVQAGIRVALITQPYRVAGRRTPPPAPHLDEAWTTAVHHVHQDSDLPLLTGGRSSGARVACRTAESLGAAAVLALAFPLHPPGRPEKSRAQELPITIPTLIVNGDRDPFGIPTPEAHMTLLIRPGATHDLRKNLTETTNLIMNWLQTHHWTNATL